MQGQRLPDSAIGRFPCPLEDLPPGAYWKALSHTGEPLDVRANPDDRRWWISLPKGTVNLTGDDARFASNLTGSVWGVITPDGRYGMLSLHTVREHEDGTISVRPGDGSSNSILVSGGSDPGSWHGYIEHGVWSEC